MSMQKPILVVKIGTTTLLGKHETPRTIFDLLAAELKLLAPHNRIVLVTSGAIGFGVRALGLDGRPTELSQLQALAMIGQTGLLRRWREAFGDTMIGQVLVSRHDLLRQDAAHTLAHSIEAVWAYGAIPIVNENDAVTYDEISFGDNDQLAAAITVTFGAARLVLLTDQDGIQEGFGTSVQRRLEVVSVIEMERHISPTKSALGKGGMESKVIAASHALKAGAEVYIGQVNTTHTLASILSGKSGTRIVQ